MPNQTGNITGQAFSEIKFDEVDGVDVSSKTTITTEHSYTCKLSVLLERPELYQNYLDAKVQVHIPGGGDWSNMTVSPEDLTCTVTAKCIVEKDYA